jgi:inosine-uridine nucleoside N-ribohydrolase/formylmethanofuran dehydrogenase subunit E
MKRIIFLLFLLILMKIVWSQPIPVKSRHTVIIDTDCAIDDMRAISILLSRPEITIEAITTCDGSLPPDEGAIKVKSLINEFNRSDIPVARGDIQKEINPPWREFNRQINWGDEKINGEIDLNAVSLCEDKLKNADESIILICLGPLTNIARLIKSDKKLLLKIERIIWYNDAVMPLHGFNFICDSNSVKRVFSSGIRIDVISNLHNEFAFFDSAMFAVSKQSDTKLANIFNQVYSQPAVIEKLNQNHFRLSDDLISLYITNPELFDMSIMPYPSKTRYNQNFDVHGVREAFCDMLQGVYVSERNVVFNNFPDKREMFNYDIRPIMDSAISRYGNEEWKANVMSSEFHGHLGVFSIVGAKMGIKARELFNVGPDMLTVITFAGSNPPYSCLNDGIQVSTGATIGMGTIQIATDSITRPSAIFTYKNQSFRISLKKEYLEQVDSDILEGIKKFGLMDDGYWKLVRRNALQYWLEWDRDQIFDIEEISSMD